MAKVRPIRLAVICGSIIGLSTLTGCSGEATEGEVVNASGITYIEREPLPLDEYRNMLWGLGVSNEESLLRVRAEEARRTELIIQCMHDLGFEYDPIDMPMGTIHGSGVTGFGEWNHWDRDWVAQYGYGIMRQNDIITWSAPMPEVGTREMSESELFAFREALEGPFDGTFFGGFILDQLEDGLTQREIQERGGCQGWAENTIADETPPDLWQLDEWAPLNEAMSAIGNARIRPAQPTMEEVDWAACMANSGYPGFTRRTNPDTQSIGLTFPEQRISIALNRIRNMSGPDIPEERTVENTPELAELLEQEIDLALADFDCRVAVDFEARQRAEWVEEENQFINDYRAALDALRNAAEQRG